MDEPLDVALGSAAIVAVGVLGTELVVAPWVMMYISPDASLDIKSRPWVSKANPAGRKQLSGQAVLFEFSRTMVVDVLLVGGSTGSPLSNITLAT